MFETNVASPARVFDCPLRRIVDRVVGCDAVAGQPGAVCASSGVTQGRGSGRVGNAGSRCAFNLPVCPVSIRRQCNGHEALSVGSGKRCLTPLAKLLALICATMLVTVDPGVRVRLSGERASKVKADRSCDRIACAGKRAQRCRRSRIAECIFERVARDGNGNGVGFSRLSAKARSPL